MSAWNIRLLGEFRIAAEDGTVISLPGKKHQAMIAYVATAPGKSVGREKLLNLLWGSRSEGQAKQSLRGVLSETNKALRAHAETIEAESPLESDRAHVSLTESLVICDTDLLPTIKKSQDLDEMLSFVREHGGGFIEFLKINEQEYQAWRLTESEKYRQNYSELLQNLLAQLAETSRTDDLIQIADHLLRFDDADELAHRALMNNYARLGKQTLAARQFAICKQRLHAEYGIEPSALTVDLYEQIKSTAPEPGTGVVLTDDKAKASPAATRAATRSLGIAIAIRPFTASETDADGNESGVIVAEEIVSAVARVGWFRVVPRNESFKASLAALGPTELSELLHARYIVEGRLRRIGNNYGLTIDLTDGHSASTVWSERFTIDIEDLPYANDIVSQIASRIDVHLRISEIGRIHQLDKQELSAYECSLLALSSMYNLTEDSFKIAEELFNRGVKQNPEYSTIHSFWCLWRMFCMGQSWAKDPAAELTETAAIARRAIQLDPSNAIALAISGQFESYWNHDFRQGVKKFKQSIAANPNSSFVWMMSSATYSYLGQPEEGLQRLHKASELCPIQSPLEFMYDCAYCIAYNFNKDFEQAAESGYRVITENPGFTNGYKLLLVALGQMKQATEAEKVLKRLLKLDPGFNVRDFLTQYPFNQQIDREIFSTGLLQAGVPPTPA